MRSGQPGGQTGCCETSIRSYNSTLRKTPQQPDLNMLPIYSHFTKKRCSNKIWTFFHDLLPYVYLRPRIQYSHCRSRLASPAICRVVIIDCWGILQWQSVRDKFRKSSSKAAKEIHIEWCSRWCAYISFLLKVLTLCERQLLSLRVGISNDTEAIRSVSVSGIKS